MQPSKSLYCTAALGTCLCHGRAGEPATSRDAWQAKNAGSHPLGCYDFKSAEHNSINRLGSLLDDNAAAAIALLQASALVRRGLCLHCCQLPRKVAQRFATTRSMYTRQRQSFTSTVKFDLLKPSAPPHTLDVERVAPQGHQRYSPQAKKELLACKAPNSGRAGTLGSRQEQHAAFHYSNSGEEDCTTTLFCWATRRYYTVAHTDITSAQRLCKTLSPTR